MSKIVYIVGGLYQPNGMSGILTRKINYLAEHTAHELYMVLTERSDLPWFYTLSPKVKWVNFDINFDELDVLPPLKKLLRYVDKQRRYKRLLTDYLVGLRPDITVSAVRREINFINDIPDGSRKVGEFHFNKLHYRDVHLPFLPEAVNTMLSRVWMRRLEKQLSRLDKFVVLTEEDARLWNIPQKVVIPNFIQQTHVVRASLHSKKAIAVGRYTAQKGFDMLIKAWKTVAEKHPDWTLDIYGAGDRQAYLDMVDRLQLSSVVRCNPSETSIYEKYADSAMFVLSSRYEGLPLVLIEAMSCGLPCVAYACPCGPRDIFEDGKYGLLVENGHVELLAEGICRLISDARLREEYAGCSLARAAEYQQESVMQKWIALFDDMG